MEASLCTYYCFCWTLLFHLSHRPHPIPTAIQAMGMAMGGMPCGRREERAETVVEKASTLLLTANRTPYSRTTPPKMRRQEQREASCLPHCDFFFLGLPVSVCPVSLNAPPSLSLCSLPLSDAASRLLLPGLTTTNASLFGGGVMALGDASPCCLWPAIALRRCSKGGAA